MKLMNYVQNFNIHYKLLVKRYERFKKINVINRDDTDVITYFDMIVIKLRAMCIENARYRSNYTAQILLTKLGDKIRYYIKQNYQGTSHVYGGYNHLQYDKPYVYLTFVKEKYSPYVHETVHIIAWDFSSLWIREGLAVYLNDYLKGYPSFPNRQISTHKLFNEIISNSSFNGQQLNVDVKKVLALIGKNGIPQFESLIDRKVFYVFSASFVQYLYEDIGVKDFMKLYSLEDTKKAILEITDKEMKKWKDEWIEYIKTINE